MSQSSSASAGVFEIMLSLNESSIPAGPQGREPYLQCHRLFQMGVPRSRSFDVAVRGREG